MTGIEEALAAVGASAAASSAAAGGTAAAAGAGAAAVGTGAAAAGATAAGLVVPLTTGTGALLSTLPAAGTSLSALGTYASLASSGLGAISALRAGMTQGAIADANATTQRVNAGATLNATEATAAQQQRATLRKLATGQNAFASSGIDASSGSALDVMGDMAAEGALDTQIARWKGGTQADAQLTSSAQQNAQAGAARTAGLTGAGTTLLTGATQLASQRQYANMLARTGGMAA